MDTSTEIGSLFEGLVKDVSGEGNGVVDHPSGRVFFVRGVWTGDKGVFKILETKKNYGHAKLEKLLEKSPARIEAPCPHHGFDAGLCGGCPWQFLKYEEQLKTKESRLRFLLNKRKLPIEGRIKPVQGSENVFGYRNRAQFKTDGTQIGFVSEGTKQIAPISDCLVLSEKNRNTLASLIQTLPREDFKPTQGYVWNFIDIDENISANEVVINKRRPFRQGNSRQNEFMKQWLHQKLDSQKRGPLLELFAGSGNFTEVASKLGYESILAVESVQTALDSLDKRGLPGVRTLAYDLYQADAFKKIASSFPNATVMLLDPPREGLENKKFLFESFPRLQDILYVSCSMDSFARDAKDLDEAGFKIAEIQPLDQFPHTPHLEILAHFIKN